MIKNLNPFIVTGKIPDAYFCDRETESEQMVRFLGSQENVVLMSQRNIVFMTKRGKQNRPVLTGYRLF